MYGFLLWVVGGVGGGCGWGGCEDRFEGGFGLSGFGGGEDLLLGVCFSIVLFEERDGRGRRRLRQAGGVNQSRGCYVPPRPDRLAPRLAEAAHLTEGAWVGATGHRRD